MLYSPVRALSPQCRRRRRSNKSPLNPRRPIPAVFSPSPWCEFSKSSLMASSVEECCSHGGGDRDGGSVGVDAGVLSLSEWQRWGTDSPFPALVNKIVGDMKTLEREAGVKMSFGGVRSKLMVGDGDFKTLEEEKHRKMYDHINDPCMKLQYYSARQIACRVLGSRGYLCQKCWLPLEEDCMCSGLAPNALLSGIRFWIYMHPKDFLRQNNTGKLLWQIFGTQAATLCLFGIHEHEEIMWDSFKSSGKNTVWLLYPNANSFPKSVQDINLEELQLHSEHQDMVHRDVVLNFILLDGTWSNSTALYKRLKMRWTATWEEDHPPCISLSTLGASAMHKLRPQPAWDRTCTAAAAAGLLRELHMRPELATFQLDEQAAALENSLDVLLDALTARRLRMGRSITRKERRNIYT